MHHEIGHPSFLTSSVCTEPDQPITEERAAAVRVRSEPAPSQAPAWTPIRLICLHGYLRVSYWPLTKRSGVHPLRVIGWEDKIGFSWLSLGAQPSYRATPIILTFTSLAQLIYREENDNTGTNTGTPTTISTNKQSYFLLFCINQNHAYCSMNHFQCQTGLTFHWLVNPSTNLIFFPPLHIICLNLQQHCNC